MIGRLATSTDTISLRRANWQRPGAVANTWLATAPESNVEHIHIIKSRVGKLKHATKTGTGVSSMLVTSQLASLQ